MAFPPGPRRPPLMQALSWVLRPGAFMDGCRRRYGDCFTVRLGVGEAATRLVFIADPEAVKAVFTAGPELAPVGSARQTLAPMFGQRSILLLDGPEHLRQRRLMLPPFHGERLGRYAELMADVTQRELDGWPLGRRFALQPRMQAITLEVILVTVFGLDEPARRAEVRHHIQRVLGVVANPFSELALGLPSRIGPVNVRAGFERKRDEMDAMLLDEIARRRRDPLLAEREDILSLLVQARDEDGEPMTDHELRDELVTLLLAGHETTATALAWTFDLLFRHGDALERVTAECRDEDGDGRYLGAVIKEVLRLRPPLPIVDRTLAAPLVVNGYELPAGTIVAPCIYLVHGRSDLYPDPQAFRPERFLERPPETYGWLPFGGGMRRCLGASFATLELEVVLKTILARARLRGASRRAERIRRRAIVLAPARGARAVLEERLPA